MKEAAIDLDVSTRSDEAPAAQLERFITQHHEKRKQTEGERLEEELYAESVRRFQERARAERRTRWIDYHRHLQVLHQNLADEHEAEAQKLLESEATRGAA